MKKKERNGHKNITPVGSLHKGRERASRHDKKNERRKKEEKDKKDEEGR